MFNEYWFKPKRLGYGATPTTWEGWTLQIGFAVLVLGVGIAAVNGQVAALHFLAITVLGAILLFVVSKAKTDGEWRWRDRNNP